MFILSYNAFFFDYIPHLDELAKAPNVCVAERILEGEVER